MGGFYEYFSGEQVEKVKEQCAWKKKENWQSVHHDCGPTKWQEAGRVIGCEQATGRT